MRTIDLASKRRDEEERQKAERRDSEKERRDSEKENDPEKPKPKAASKPNPFGAAKAVDTSTREKEIEERLKKQNDEKRNDSKLPRNVDRYLKLINIYVKSTIVFRISKNLVIHILTCHLI